MTSETQAKGILSSYLGGPDLMSDEPTDIVSLLGGLSLVSSIG
jgi:hypothetical protein